MKSLLAVLNDPKKGGKIVLPRRLLRLMLGDSPARDYAQACVKILLDCNYEDDECDDGLKMGEMRFTLRRLADELDWSKTRTENLLMCLSNRGLVRLKKSHREMTQLTWTNYASLCRLGDRKVPLQRRREEKKMSEEELREFETFWVLYHKRSHQRPHDRFLAQSEWMSLSGEERRKALVRMEDYFRSLASMDYVRSGVNYLKYRSFM